MAKVRRLFILMIIASILSSCSDMKWKDTVQAEVRFPVFHTDRSGVEFWGQKDEGWYEAAAENFNASQSKVKVVIDYIEPPMFAESYLFESKEGLPFDIIRFDSFSGWDFERVVNEMPEMLADMTLYYMGSNESIPHNIFLSGVRNERLYMIPTRLSIGALRYNKNMFDEWNIPYPPEDWTWNQFLDISVQIQEQEGYWSSYYPMYPPIDLLGTLLRSSESSLLSPDEQTAVGYMDSEEVIQAVRWIKSYYNRVGRVEWRPDGSVSPINDTNVVINHTSATRYYEGAGTSYMREQKEIIPYPHLDGTRRSNSASVHGLGISSKSKNPEAAWAFINYLALEANKDSLEYVEGYIPASEVLAAEARQFADSNLLFFLDEVKYVIPSRHYVFWKVWNDELREQFEEILEAPDHEIPDLMHKLALAFDVERERQFGE